MDASLTQPLDPAQCAQLIEAAGSPAFSPMVLKISCAIAEVQEVFGYIARIGQKPECLVAASHMAGSTMRVEAYLQRFYQHDPAVHELQGVKPDSGFVQAIRDIAIIPHDYRRLCFADPGFREKLSFGWQGSAHLLVLSFYSTDVIAAESASRLANLANLALAVMQRHHVHPTPEELIDQMERRIKGAFPALSHREIQICSRSLLGWEASVIAKQLGIGKGSVFTYRQRAYQKAGFSRAADFLPFVVA